MSTSIDSNFYNVDRHAIASGSRNASRIDDIPDQVLQKIFSLLPKKIQSDIRNVNQNWRHISKQFTRSLNAKTLIPELGDLFPELRSVNIVRAEILRDEQLFGLAKLQNLNFLSLINAVQLTSHGIRHLELCRKLTSLNLDSCTGIDDNSLMSLGTLERLETLKLSRCSEITGAGLANLERLRHLKALNLFGSGASTDDGLFNLRRFSQLKILILGESTTSASDGKITNLGLQSLSHLDQLSGLGLLNCSRIGDRGMKNFKTLMNLEILSLRGCRQLSRGGIAYTMLSPNLKVLDLSYCHVDEVCIKSLSKYRPNVAVEVTGCEISPETRKLNVNLSAAGRLPNNQSIIAMFLQALGSYSEVQGRCVVEKILKRENAAGDNSQISALALLATYALNHVRNNNANTAGALQTGRFTRFLGRCRQVAVRIWAHVRHFGTWCLSFVGL